MFYDNLMDFDLFNIVNINIYYSYVLHSNFPQYHTEFINDFYDLLNKYIWYFIFKKCIGLGRTPKKHTFD